MTSDDPQRRTAPAQLLQDLLADSLDPGYREAAARRAATGAQAGHWYDRPAVALGCLLAGFVLVVAYVHTHRGAPEAERVHAQLVQKVRTAEQDNDRLGDRIATAQRGLAGAQARALPTSGALSRRLALEQEAGGTSAVHGPGLTVTLREPAGPTPTDVVGRGGSTPVAATNILTDRDLRSVVNELWHDGAEAIAVNGIRLTPTSAIRFAGEAVLVDFDPISSPYTVEAIGDPDTLATRFASSDVASRYKTLVSADGIGFSFHNEDDLSLPAGTQVNPRYASAVPTPASVTPSSPTPSSPTPSPLTPSPLTPSPPTPSGSATRSGR